MASRKPVKARASKGKGAEARQSQTKNGQSKKAPAKKAQAWEFQAKRALNKKRQAGPPQPAQQNTHMRLNAAGKAEATGSESLDPTNPRDAREIARIKRAEEAASQQPSQILLSAGPAAQTEASPAPSPEKRGKGGPNKVRAGASKLAEQPSQDQHDAVVIAHSREDAPPSTAIPQKEERLTRAQAAASQSVQHGVRSQSDIAVIISLERDLQTVRGQSDIAVVDGLGRDFTSSLGMPPQSPAKGGSSQPPIDSAALRPIKPVSKAPPYADAATQVTANDLPRSKSRHSPASAQRPAGPEVILELEAGSRLQETPMADGVHGGLEGIRQADGSVPDAESANTGHQTIGRLPTGLARVMEDIKAGRKFMKKLQPEIDRASQQCYNNKLIVDKLTFKLFPGAGGYDERLKMFNPGNKEHQEIFDALLESQNQLSSLQQKRSARDMVLSTSRRALEDVLFDSLGDLLPESQLSERSSFSSIVEEQPLQDEQRPRAIPEEPTPPPATTGKESVVKIVQASDGSSEPTGLQTEEEGARPAWLKPPRRLVYQASNDAMFRESRHRAADVRRSAKQHLKDVESAHDHFRESWPERKFLHDIARQDGRNRETFTELADKYRKDGAAHVQAFNGAERWYSDAASVAQWYSISLSDSQSSRFASNWDTNNLSGRGYYSQRRIDKEQVARWNNEVPRAAEPEFPVERWKDEVPTTPEFRSAISMFADPPNGSPEFGDGEPDHTATRRARRRLDKWDDETFGRWRQMMDDDQVRWYKRTPSGCWDSGDVVYPRSDGGESGVPYEEDTEAPWFYYQPPRLEWTDTGRIGIYSNDMDVTGADGLDAHSSRDAKQGSDTEEQSEGQGTIPHGVDGERKPKRVRHQEPASATTYDQASAGSADSFHTAADDPELIKLEHFGSGWAFEPRPQQQQSSEQPGSKKRKRFYIF